MKISFSDPLTRREFIASVTCASVSVALTAGGLAGKAAEAFSLPIVLFSKAYQPLKLTFEQAAELTVEAGLDGVDSPVRPDGEIAPERAADDLPAYAAALRKHGLRMPFITTAITSPSSAHAETLLRTAKSVGVEFYRLGFMDRVSDDAWPKQLADFKHQLKGLAALNKDIGISAVIQNHSPSGRTYVGGNVDELAEIVSDFDPAQVGVAFDIAHALKVHGDGWRQRFDKIRSHLKVVYVKDVNRAGHFVRLGEGEVGTSGYFKVLKQTGYRAPICLHVEYDWMLKAQPETRPELFKALKDSVRVLKGWLAEA